MAVETEIEEHPIRDDPDSEEEQGEDSDFGAIRPRAMHEASPRQTKEKSQYGYSETDAIENAELVQEVGHGYLAVRSKAFGDQF